MGAMVATITRRVSSLSQAPYFARTATGVEIGAFATVPLAKSAVQRMVGGKPLRWSADLLAGGVEAWRADGTEYSPLDSDGLVTWNDATQGIQLYPASTKCQLWGDWSQTSHPQKQSTVASMPQLSLAGPGGLDQLLFGSLAVDEFMESDLALTPPFTLSAVLTPSAVPGGIETALQVHNGAAARVTFEVLPGGAPRWAVNNGALLVGPLTGGNPNVMTLVQTATAGSLWIGGTLIGANATAPGAGTNVRIGLPAFGATIRWNNGISAVYAWRRALFGTELTNFHNYAITRFAL